MTRRMYFLFPDVDHTVHAVTELQQAGIALENMHTVARENIDIDPLPVSNEKQQHNITGRLEKWLWNANLLVFALALVALVAMAISAAPASGLGLLLGIVILTFLLGYELVRHVPGVHIDEFNDAIAHGEIRLMVDVPVSRMDAVEHQAHRGHPEAVTGGVG